MTMGRLAVIAATPPETAAATAALAALGAPVATRPGGRERVFVTGRFVEEAVAREAVAMLRAQGWAATQRPEDHDPFIVAWQHRTAAVSVAGGRLVVALPWAEYDRDATPLAIEVDPGGAFGGGTHPTTRLLLEQLAARLHGGERVLDVGCGSGVLALAAVRLGAGSAVGIDVEPEAIAATRANAIRNGMAAQVTGAAIPLAEVPGRYDVIVANIGLEVLLSMAVDLEARLEPGGWLGLSGISPTQDWRLMAAFRRIRAVDTTSLDDWIAIVASD